MIVVIEQKTKEILLFSHQEITDEVSIQHIYPEFDESIMEVAYGDFDTLPENFDIVDGKVISLTLEQAIDAGQIELPFEKKVERGGLVDKSLDELVAAGLVDLSPEEKLVDGKILGKSLKELVEEGITSIDEPFEFINEHDELDYRPLGEIVANNLINTLPQAEMALNILNDGLTKDIEQCYSVGKESKLLKAYICWIQEGQPEGDSRQVNYIAMQQHIEEVKAQYQPMKNKIKDLLEELKNP